MKKFYVFAAVAIAALASCTKSEVVYNQGQQEIGFRQFTGSMTKAEGEAGPSTSALPTGTSMGVFSYLNGTETAYFKNAEFEYKSATNKWGGKTTYYWPLQGNLDFVLYAPYQSTDVTYTHSSTSSNILTVTIADNSTAQTDYLYGKDFYVNTSKPATPSDGVPVVLKHALSKVTIAAKADAASIFTVTSILLKNTIQKGSYTVTYTTDADDFTSSVTGSTDAEAKKDMVYVSSESPWNLTTDLSANTDSKFVVPSAQTSIVLKYKMAGNDTELEATVNLASESAKWETGKHYTYNLTLTAYEILFDPKVQDWDENQTTSNKDVI
ncbi:MAG: fimbrillin family protein [Candidatus Cryptobacteroides sp.]